MQEGQKAGLNRLTIDLNLGSYQNNTPMDRSDSWDNKLYRVNDRLSNYILAPADGNISCTSSASNRGESSVGGHHLQGRTRNYHSKARLSLLNDTMSEDWSLGPSSIQNGSLNCGSLNLSSNNGHVRGASPPHALCKHDSSGKQHIPTFCVSSTNVGTSSGNSSIFTEINDASGASCKRKSVENTSRHFYDVRSSNSNQPMDDKNLRVSSGSQHLSYTSHLEQLNPRNGFSTGRVSPDFFPSSSVPGIAEIPARNFALRSNLGQHEPVRRHSRVHAISNTDTLELMPSMAKSMNSSNALNQPLIPRERGSDTHQEAKTRGPLRNNPEYHATAPETRNVLQEQIDRSFAYATPASSRNYYSRSEIGPSSRERSSSTTRLPYRNQATRNHQRLSEAGPGIHPPPMESEPRIRRSTSVLFPLALSSSDEMATTSHGQHQLHQRSAAFLTDIMGDDIHGCNGLAAVDGRHRLIRQVLNAVRRGYHLRAEDSMLINPLGDAFAELHDRHRDLRLDLDNMSYEELLALEERIGTVDTGLSEEKIRGFMKQRKYEAAVRTMPNLEPCCICQEDYDSGDDIGKLECGHEFHTNCIEGWLKLKNLCPICKMTAL